jgi:gamma-glutamylaminecyclotransferase
MVADKNISVTINGEPKQSTTAALIFTYGTLKRNFSNHPLLQDLIKTNDASFIGTYRTVQNYPLVCGPYRVPFLLNIPGSGQPVYGELYSVSSFGLSRMDELEGTTKNHYERLPIKIVPAEEEGEEGGREVQEVTSAEAYYAHGNYAMEMWKKNGKRGLKCYTEKETIGYVKRKDRPQHLTFLDHIRLFLSD